MVQHSRGVAEHSSSLSSAGRLTLSRVAERHKIEGLRLVCQYLGETGIPVSLLPGMISTKADHQCRLRGNRFEPSTLKQHGIVMSKASRKTINSKIFQEQANNELSLVSD